MAELAIEKLNRVRYVGNDFDTHFDDLRGRLQVEFAEDFNDFALSSLGIMLLDLVAYGLDSLSFYLDRRASDAYLDTARTRKAVARLSRQLGYKIGAAVASSVDVRVAITAPVPFSVPVPKGFQFKGPNELVFETAELVTFDPGSGPNEPKFIPCYEGETVVENFVSNGSANQSFDLARVPDKKFIVQGTVRVTVNAAPWTESEFITFDKTDQFEVGYNDEPPTLRFGDGVAGNLPTVAAAITATYVASSGLAGQVVAGSILESVDPLIVLFQEIPLSIENLESSIGGDDPEALEKVKVFAGKVFKSRQVAVTRSDYKALAGSFADPLYGRVAVAQAVSSRSAAQDLALLNSLFTIRSLINPVKAEVNGLTNDARTVFGSMVTDLAEVEVQLQGVADNDTDASALLTTALTNARTAKNTAVEMNNDANDIVNETIAAAADVDAVPVATANLVIGAGNARLLYVAKIPGALGTAVRIEHIITGSILVISVVNNDITISYPVTIQANQIADGIGLAPAAAALVDVYDLYGGQSTAPAFPLTNLGFTAPNSLPISGLVDSTQALLQQHLDRCKTEANSILSAAAGIQGVLDAAIAANILAALDKLAASGYDLTTLGTRLTTAQKLRTALAYDVGEALPLPIGATDGETVVSSSTFTGSGFAAADVGRLLEISTGGNAGFYRVVAYLSSTTVTLANLDGSAFFGQATVTGLSWTFWTLYLDAARLDSSVVTLDTTGAVAVSVGVELDDIYDHVDKLLADDCKSNLVTVPVLTRNVSGFYTGPSLGLQQSLQAYLDERKEVTQTVKVTSGVNSLVNAIVTARVSVLPGFAESVVKATVATVLDGVLRNRQFGASLYVSELSDAVSTAVDGLAFLNITINGYRDPLGVFQTDKLDSNGNLIIANSEVVTKDLVVLPLPALSGVLVTTEIFSQGV